MNNSKENLDQMRVLKDEIQKLELVKQNADIRIQKAKREIEALNESKKEWLRKAAWKKKLEHQARLQTQIINALREIGKPCVSGLICDKMNKSVGSDMYHGTTFITIFGEAVKNDKRIIIKELNATKFEYSLREWQNEKTT